VSKILVISYLFPPSGGVGIARTMGYAKYFPRYADTYVLAPSNAGTPAQDHGLLELIPPETTVVRAFSPTIPYALRDRVWKRIVGSRNSAKSAAPAHNKIEGVGFRQIAKRTIENVMSPDPQALWVPFARRQARKLIRRHGIDTVLLIAPPFSLLRLVIDLKGEFPGVRFITDFRDEVRYYLKHLDHVPSAERLGQVEQLEERALRCSDYISAVTWEQVDLIRNRYPFLPKEKFLCVPNGFDAEVCERFVPKPPRKDKLVIGYFGTVYKTPICSPEPFLDAVGRLDEETRQLLEIRFVGRVALEARDLLENRPYRITQTGFMPLIEGLQQLEDADYLMLVGDHPTTLGGKTLDYLALGKPIIAMTPPGGVIARLLERTRAGWAVDNNRDAIFSFLSQACHWWRTGTAPPGFQPDRSAVNSYSRGHIVAELAQALGLSRS
jgi:hypothetical protein